MASNVMWIINFIYTVHMMGFSSEADLENHYRTTNDDSTKYPFSLIFNVNSSMLAFPRDITYKIRPETKDNDKWQTRQVFSFYQVLSPRNDTLDCKELIICMLHLWVCVHVILCRVCINEEKNVNKYWWAKHLQNHYL